MTPARARSIGRQMENAIQRQVALADEVRLAAEEGCPVAMAVLKGLDDNSLPHPSTAVKSIVEDALATR